MHSNTLAVGVTVGPPIQLEEAGPAALFNKMYYDAPGSFFERLVCDYGQEARETVFTNNSLIQVLILSNNGEGSPQTLDCYLYHVCFYFLFF